LIFFYYVYLSVFYSLIRFGYAKKVRINFFAFVNHRWVAALFFNTVQIISNLFVILPAEILKEVIYANELKLLSIMSIVNTLFFYKIIFLFLNKKIKRRYI